MTSFLDKTGLARVWEKAKAMFVYKVGTASGSGNVVTGLSISNGVVTPEKGITALTSHQSLSNCAQTVTTTGSGNAITAISKSGSTITATKGSTFLTSHQSLDHINKNSSFLDGGIGRLSYYDAQIGTTTNNSNAWSRPAEMGNDWSQVLHLDLSVGTFWNELLFPVNGTEGLFWRQRRGSNYYGWYKILDSNNYASVLGNIYQAKGSYAAASHTHTFASLTSKPTTLAGYGITDAKISNGTITLGSSSITPVTSSQLPTAIPDSVINALS